jgi:membrane fusion protein, multidrug efflux system
MTPETPSRYTVKRQLIIGFSCAFGIVLILGLVKFLQIRKAIAEHASFAMPPEAVTSMVVNKQPWPELFQATADLAPTQGVMIKNELTGRVSEILVTPGQEVEAGIPLIHLDASLEKAELVGAEAEAVRAEKDYRRTLSLFESKALSQGALDTARATLSLAKANVDRLTALIAKKHIRAPFAGTVGMRLSHTGESYIRMNVVSKGNVKFEES